MPLFQSAKFPSPDAGGNGANGCHYGSWALWRISEPEEELLAMLDGTYFPQEELLQIRVPQRRLEWLACRLALQQLLPQGSEVRLCKNQWGRPYLQPGMGHISLSHSYPFAAAALHPSHAVGIDLEQAREQLVRIKHKFLSPEEQALAGDDPEKLCLYWTAKEALYKLKGKPGVIFARDIMVGPDAKAGAGILNATLEGEPYALHHQWHDKLLMCVAIGTTN